MKHNLLIIGGGIYGIVAKDVAQDMNRFSKIAFVDDFAKETPNGVPIIGTCNDLPRLSNEFDCVAVAIGNPTVRSELFHYIEQETSLQITTLISPKAYVSPSAEIGIGCIIEPMAVIHTSCILGKGCFICAGAVVNHASRCGDFDQIDCNATVIGGAIVPEKIKVYSGTVYPS